METKDENETISVFISYSWDTEEHKEWVLNLANELTDNGVYVILDRFDLKAGKAMTHFMEKAVNQADKVLLIMTPKYKDKADNRLGGVGYEYSMISQELYEKIDNDKFIPIRREGSYAESAPKFLKSFLSHDMTNDVSYKSDFIELLRIICDEPEIKRRPLGKKPDFITKKATQKSTSLIDDTVNLQRSQMTSCAKWTIDISLNSLEDQQNHSLYNLITSNAKIDKDNKLTLPHILGHNFKKSHQPTILYENPLQRYLAYNHLAHEILLIDEGLIHYEFSEYGNQEFWLLYINQPFSTLFYLLSILKSIHEQLNRSVDLTININFESDSRSLLYSNHSPFNFPHLYSLQTMEIPGNKASMRKEVTELTSDSVFSLFEQLYSLFSNENPNSPYPFVKLDREHFDMVINDFL